MMKKCFYRLRAIMMICVIGATLLSCGNEGDSSNTGGDPEKVLTGWYVDLSQTMRYTDFTEINRDILLNQQQGANEISVDDFVDSDGWFSFLSRKSKQYWNNLRSGITTGGLKVVHIINDNTLAIYYADLYKQGYGRGEELYKFYSGPVFGTLVYKSESPTFYTYTKDNNKIYVPLAGTIFTITSQGLFEDGTSGVLGKYDPSVVHDDNYRQGDENSANDKLDTEQKVKQNSSVTITFQNFKWDIKIYGYKLLSLFPKSKIEFGLEVGENYYETRLTKNEKIEWQGIGSNKYYLYDINVGSLYWYVFDDPNPSILYDIYSNLEEKKNNGESLTVEERELYSDLIVQLNDCIKKIRSSALGRVYVSIDGIYYYLCDIDFNVQPVEESSSLTGDGTFAFPFTAVGAAQEAEKLAVGETSTKSYYIKGKISAIKYYFSEQYGTATFYISDDGKQTEQFYIYGAYYLGNRNWVEGDTQIGIGDDVIVYGKLANYKGILETADKENYIYSLNGKTK